MTGLSTTAGVRRPLPRGALELELDLLAGSDEEEGERSPRRSGEVSGSGSRRKMDSRSSSPPAAGAS